MVKRKGLPRWSELVLCRVTRITPYAAWCELEEYEDEDGKPIEGMVHISEVAGKWVKDIRGFVKINKQYVARVVRVDYQKRSINLSLKRVTKFDKKEKMEGYKREKHAAGFLQQIAKRVGSTPEEVYEKLAQPLQAALEKESEGGAEGGFEGSFESRFKDLLAVFEAAHENADILKDAGLPQKLAEAVQDILAKSFKKKEVMLKAELQITSVAPDGVERIRGVLAELERSTGAAVSYISAPVYRVELKTKQPKDDERMLKEAMDAAIEKIKSAEGEGSYKFIK
jgi:translation initiation factor 2 subunit 1